MIEPDVREEIVREIDFQIGYFKNNVSARSLDIPVVHVFPYIAWEALEVGGSEQVEFYTSTGKPGKYLIEKSSRLCIKITDSVIEIYADYPNFLINLYIQLLLAPRGLSMVHAGGFQAASGAVTLVTGAGGIGKTAIVGHAVRDRGLKHMGDDIIVVGKAGDCYSFPRAFVLKSYHREMYSETFSKMKLPRWNLFRIKRFIIENAPFVGIGKSFLKSTGLYYQVADLLRPKAHLATVSSDEIFGKNAVLGSGTLARLVYLERADVPEFRISQINATEMSNRMFSVIHYEWKDFVNHLLSLGALNIVDLNEYFKQTIENLNTVVGNASLVYVLIPKHATPDELIDFLARKEIFD